MQNKLKKCAFCKEMFESHYPNEKYCSDDCRKFALEEQNRKKSRIKTCKNCGKEFETHYSQAKYCSDKCHNLFHNKKYSTNGNLYFYYDKFKILDRDNFTCIYCGKNSYEDNIKLHLDHLFPKSKGGKNTADNLVTSCSKCNLSKSNKIIKSFENIKKEIKKRNKRLKINNKLKIRVP